jgi:hypothetical protein
MADKVDIERFRVPPFPQTYVTRERAIVEENRDSNLILVESEYRSLQPVNRPPDPIRVTKACGDSGTWRIIGNHTTESNGEKRINLTKFLNCANVDFANSAELMNSNFLGSISLFLATAQSGEPVFLTYELDVSSIPLPPPPPGGAGGVFIPNPAIDVNVVVKSWRHDGAPAPSIQFSWMAIGEKSFFYNP